MDEIIPIEPNAIATEKKDNAIVALPSSKSIFPGVVDRVTTRNLPKMFTNPPNRQTNETAFVSLLVLSIHPGFPLALLASS